MPVSCLASPRTLLSSCYRSIELNVEHYHPTLTHVMHSDRMLSHKYHPSKINVTPKGVRLSEKLQLTAALCNEI